MWNYKNVTRLEFEQIKDKIEKFIVMLGGIKLTIDLPYMQISRSYFGGNTIKNISTRPVFKYQGEYYRVDEVCFPEKPFIVIEGGSFDDVMNNTMEDIDPFPYDLTDDELFNEVKMSLGIEPYPQK